MNVVTRLSLSKQFARNLVQTKKIINLKYKCIPSVNCKIELLTPKYLDAALDLTERVFIHNEKICKAMEVAKYPEALKEWMEIPKQIAKQGLSLITVNQDTNDISAITFNLINVKNDGFYEKILESYKHPVSKAYLQYFIDIFPKSGYFEHTQSETAFEPVLSFTAPEYVGKGLQHHINQITFGLLEELVKCKDGETVVIDGTEVFLKRKPETYTQMPNEPKVQNMAKYTNNLTLLAALNYGVFEFQGKPLSDFIKNEEEKEIHIYYKKLI